MCTGEATGANQSGALIALRGHCGVLPPSTRTRAPDGQDRLRQARKDVRARPGSPAWSNPHPHEKTATARVGEMPLRTTLVSGVKSRAMFEASHDTMTSMPTISILLQSSHVQSTSGSSCIRLTKSCSTFPEGCMPSASGHRATNSRLEQSSTEPLARSVYFSPGNECSHVWGRREVRRTTLGPFG